MVLWGTLASLGAALVWAVSSLLLKPLSTQFPALALNGLRSLTAAIFFALLLMATGKEGLLGQTPPGRAAALLVGTFIGVAVGESLFLLTLRYMDVSRAYPISICAYPLVTVLLAAVFLGETLTWAAALGAALVLAGTFLVAAPHGGFSSTLSPQEKTGLLLVGLTVVTWGIATVLIREGVRGSDIVVANTLRLSGTALAILLVTYRDWGRFLRHGRAVPAGAPSRTDPPLSRRRLLALGAITGFLSFGIGGALFLIALEYVGAGRTSLLSSV
ncbi:MAG: DMT family transporter, partial [Chloroflexota bacterium]